MCLEVKNDYQKLSLLKVYLGRSKYGGGGGGIERLFDLWVSKSLQKVSSLETFSLGLLGGSGGMTPGKF